PTNTYPLSLHDALPISFNQKLTLDHTAPAVLEVKASKEGFVSRCDARIIGEVVRDLGGGRLTKDSVINYDVGVDQLAKPDDKMRDRKSTRLNSSHLVIS